MIARLLHVGQRPYSDYESGKIRISVEGMLILAKFYYASMDYICGISGMANPFPKKYPAVFQTAGDIRKGLKRESYFAALAARIASVSMGVTLNRSPQMP